MSRGNGAKEGVDLLRDYLMYFVGTALKCTKNVIADTEKLTCKMQLSTVRYNEIY